MMEGALQYETLLSSWKGAWISVNGNPDIYIFQGYDGSFYLLAYSYDRESERGSFGCYEIAMDESGCYVRMGAKPCLLKSEEPPYGLHIAGWGSYERLKIAISFNFKKEVYEQSINYREQRKDKVIFSFTGQAFIGIGAFVFLPKTNLKRRELLHG